MAKFIWTEQLNISIAEIDQQHHRLVEYIDQLEEACSGGRSRNKVGELIDEMVDHTIYHFTFEESMLEKSGYPFTQAHKRLHAHLVSRVSDLQARFNQGEDLSRDIHGLLVDWLLDHLKYDDSDYVESAKEYLRKHPAALKENKGWFGRLFG